MTSSVSIDALDGYDPLQVAMMEEEVILVDGQDNIVGHASKKISHLTTNINAGMLHRAFSVFLFNSQGELLLQQRASEKITFPDMWTNTCCSHPLHVPGEIDNETSDGLGVKRAAQRKLLQELGIPPEQVPLAKFKYLTRMHYKALQDDGVWGEHEVDYILFIQLDVTPNPNPNEVRAVQWITQPALKELVATAAEKGIKITPWFALIGENFLYKWWDSLSNLDGLEDHSTVHKLGIH